MHVHLEIKIWENLKVPNKKTLILSAKTAEWADLAWKEAKGNRNGQKSDKSDGIDDYVGLQRIYYNY